jgi:hypothetical protein
MAKTAAKKMKDSRERAQQIIRNKLIKTQSNYNAVNDFEVFEKYEMSFDKHFHLVKDGEQYLVIYRFWDNDSKKSSYDHETYFKEDKAKLRFKELTTPYKNTVWDNVDEKLRSALYFLRNYNSHSIGSAENYPVWDLSFMFAIQEHVENGYEYKDENGQKVIKPGTHKDLAESTKEYRDSVRRNLVRLGKGLAFNPEDPHKAQQAVERLFINIATEQDQISKKTYYGKCGVFFQALGVLKMFSRIYKNIDVLITSVEAHKESVKKAYTYKESENNEEEDTGYIVDGESYKVIPIHDLRFILDQAWSFSPEYYNAIILNLSTALRPTELSKLIEMPETCILNGCELDYKSGFLITKTKDKTDLKKIPNPRLAIVSQLILKNFKCELRDDFFTSRNANGLYYRFEAMKEYSFRCFRTTAATFLAYCDVINDDIGRCSLRVVQNRLAHKNIFMTLNVYAENAPSGNHPYHYFDWNGKFNLGPENITRTSTLWDSWLLQDFMKRHQEKMPAAEFKKLKETLVKISRNFISADSGSSGGSLDMDLD